LTDTRSIFVGEISLIFIGIFSIFAGYLDEGSEVILMEPFFDQYIVSDPRENGSDYRN